MTPVSYYVPGETTSPQWAFCFAKGCGGTITDEQELFPGPVALFTVPARWNVLKDAEREGREYYFGDHAYYGRRQFYRITRNAYQWQGTEPTPSPDRFQKFGKPIQPWRIRGGHILVCPQSAVYCRMHGFDVQQWLHEVETTIRQYTTRPIRVRWKRSRDPIGADLSNAWAVVVYSSAAALDALIAGIPVFVLAPFAASARMGLSDLSRIESPAMPEGREPFLWDLANHQWTFKEMYEGVAWRALQQEADRAA